MRIAVVAYGSRGDVQPPLSLACRLVELGHEVTVIVPKDFAEVAARTGCRAVALPREVRATLGEGSLTSSLRRGRTLSFFREAFQLEAVHRDAITETMLAATVDAELLVATPLLEDLCITLAEARGQRIALTAPMPLWANSTYPSFLLSAWPIPRFLNRLSYVLFEIGAHGILPFVNPLRKRLGLRELKRRPSLLFRRVAPPVFYWVPPTVIPPPASYGSNHRFTGYWIPPAELRAAFGETEASAELRDFLAAGPPPIFAGFGSMPVLDEHVVTATEQAAAALGLRVIFGRGWSASATTSASSLLVGGVDHDWLFPRCAAVVHHGGASTTGAAIRAGIPAVVTSVFADQPFWGRRVRALGVGESFRFQRLTAPRLQRALTRALSPTTKENARALAEQLAAAQDGAVVAATQIDAEAATFPVPNLC